MGDQVADHLIGADIDDGGAGRDADDQVIAALAVALLAHAVLAALGLEAALMAEVDQGTDVLVGLDPHIAAIAAVAAIGATQRNELLAAKADAAIATIAGYDINFCFVYEFHKFGFGKWGTGEQSGKY